MCHNWAFVAPFACFVVSVDIIREFFSLYFFFILRKLNYIRKYLFILITNIFMLTKKLIKSQSRRKFGKILSPSRSIIQRYTKVQEKLQ